MFRRENSGNDGGQGGKEVKKNEHGIGTEELRVYVPPLGLQIVYLFLIPGEVSVDGAGPTGRDGGDGSCWDTKDIFFIITQRRPITGFQSFPLVQNGDMGRVCTDVPGLIENNTRSAVTRPTLRHRVPERAQVRP